MSDVDGLPATQDGAAARFKSMLVYALTIFTSAFLLFQLQPIIAKLILPWFGGSAAVWATCLVFFQTVLLLGYLYAHGLISWLGPRLQVAIHGAAIAVSVLVLPIIPAADLKPDDPSEPALRILALLAVTVGLPYFLLSASSPLIQAWYSRGHEARFPYWLFAISNGASLAALLAYPFLIEPALPTRMQAWSWSVGYGIFAGLTILAGLVSMRGAPATAADEDLAPAIPPGVFDHLEWIVLAAFPSFLLVAITNHLNEDIATTPFLWVLPLSVYLLSFVICFGREGAYRRNLWMRPWAVAMAGMGVLLLRTEFSSTPWIAVPIFAAGLFISAMVGHGELAHSKPDARFLTSFYAMVALGGAIGGLLAGLAAPVLLPINIELQAVLTLIAIVVLFTTGRRNWMSIVVWIPVVVLLGETTSRYIDALGAGTIAADRNFYGSLRVTDVPSAIPGEDIRIMVHGTTEHGRQFLAPGLARTPTSYYGRTSGIGRLLDAVRHPARVGVVGLGTGTLAAYSEPGDVFRFYEINPLVEEYAHRYFTFLSSARGNVEVISGDGRLALERESPQGYNVLALDAFSGGSVPVHLLTVEAFALYFRHLAPDGVLALHISNKSFNLAGVVAAAADELGAKNLLIVDNASPERETSASSWVLVSRDQAALDHPRLIDAGIAVQAPPGVRPWTDDFSNLLQVLR